MKYFNFKVAGIVLAVCIAYGFMGYLVLVAISWLDERYGMETTIMALIAGIVVGAVASAGFIFRKKDK